MAYCHIFQLIYKISRNVKQKIYHPFKINCRSGCPLPDINSHVVKINTPSFKFKIIKPNLYIIQIIVGERTPRPTKHIHKKHLNTKLNRRMRLPTHLQSI